MSEPVVPDAQARCRSRTPTIYLTLLVVWLVPGLHQLEFVFGLAHGLGWIAMCVLVPGGAARRASSRCGWPSRWR